MKWSKYRSRVQCTLVKLEIILFKIGSLNLRFRHNNVTNISLPDGKTCSKNLNGVITSNSLFSKGYMDMWTCGLSANGLFRPWKPDGNDKNCIRIWSNMQY